jgi:hypothetical protein
MTGGQQSPYYNSKYFLLVMVLTIALGLSVLVTEADTPVEFSLPIPDTEAETWASFTGVGTKVKYPPGWHGRAYQAQGGVRDSATYEFTWTDAQGLVTRIELLEITNIDTGNIARTTELAYWRQHGALRGYVAEEVTVQGHTAWWIHTEKASSTGFMGTVWLDYGTRMYRLRIHSREETGEEGARRLRQILATLEVTEVDWNRAAEPPAVLLGRSTNAAPTAISGVPYNRGAAFNYAQTYYSVQNNADGCYLWYDGSTLDCVYQDGDYGVDGAHFVNRAVHAGDRPIPGLWDGAALRVADLRDWLQADGWLTATAPQAAVGDVALMGPLDNPCWVGLVVETGSDPVLATHSGEYWSPASQLYCYSGGQQTYEKTYLHIAVEYTVDLPLISRNYPLPHLIKSRTGIHLGSRQDAWPANALTQINGDPEVGGIWPRAIVVLSDQLYVLDRHPQGQDDGLCRIAQARVRLEELFTYLTEAQQHGVKIIIRVTPSPGNFQDWHELSLPHILLTDETPAGDDYCDWKYGQFRAIDDIATEMHEIYKLNVEQRGWNPAQFFFEPANEPNNEWYSYWEDKEARDRLMTPSAWQEMNSYFSSLYDYAKTLEPNLQILTPSMAQGNLAETKQFGTCTPMTITANLSGYDYMQSTYTNKNDGYSWHNYWRAGYEVWDSQPCPSEQDTPTSHHIIQYFPYWMQATILSTNKSTFITEADLLSPCQDAANSVTDKDTQAEATRESLRLFVTEEQGANSVIAWLLTEYPYSVVELCPTGLVNNEEIRWHQAYENDSERVWFRPWWLVTE